MSDQRPEDEQPVADESPQLASSGAASAPAAAKLRPLRIWPAVVLLAAMWGIRYVPQLFDSQSIPIMMLGFMGPAICGLLIILWWVGFSRATWKEKFAVLAGLITIIVTTTFLSHQTIRGFGTALYAVPCGMTAFAVVLIFASRMPARGTVALLAALAGFGIWDLIRNDGVWGDFSSSLNWRWTRTTEDEFIASLAAREASSSGRPTNDSEPLAEPEWPAFRGPNRDGVQPGIKLVEDWETSRPKELWRTRIGPGWSSFTVAGNRIFTQEQRDQQEAVVCYDARDGSEMWTHLYDSRFWEAVGGAGPRGTPTLSNGQLFAMGAEGFLFRLNPVTGEEVWRRDVRADAGRKKPPTWGFASSPLILDDLVIVHAGGADDKGVMAYDTETGEPRWGAPAGSHSYSSPQLFDVAGRSCLLMLTDRGLSFIDPADGNLIGEYEWEFEDAYRVVQPMQVGDTEFLLGTAMGMGTRRISVTVDEQPFATTEAWSTKRMNPYYNDYVQHDGYLYGFDGNIFACVDLESGDRQWKKGRYGNGQVLLLPDANQLLVISETGELVLLRTNPEKLEELTRFKVLDGRTWNHPVLVGDRLYVRNGEEAACFEMPLAASASP